MFLDGVNTRWLPSCLKGSQHYSINLAHDGEMINEPGFQALYARLSNQNRNPAPPLGKRVEFQAGKTSTGVKLQEEKARDCNGAGGMTHKQPLSTG